MREVASRPRLTPPVVIAATVLFYTLVELFVMGARSPLGWDEAIYLSQVGHGPTAWFDAPRARGITLLVAPVADLIHSLAAVRLWLTAVSAVLMVASYRVWLAVRRDRSEERRVGREGRARAGEDPS